MSIDPSNGESVGLDPSVLAHPHRATILASAPAGGSSGDNHRHAELRRKLKRLRAEDLTEMLLLLIEGHGDAVRALIEDALRKASDEASRAVPERNAEGLSRVTARGGPLIKEATLREAFDRHGRSVTRVARALGVSRMTVYRSMRRYGITRHRWDNAEAPPPPLLPES